MKLYRATVTRRADGKIIRRQVFTKPASVNSFKGYWGSRWGGTTGYTYDVVVETTFVTDWAPYNPDVEAIDKKIDRLNVSVTAEMLHATAMRLLAEVETRRAAV
jgi:hypothetical protein